jgi:hypothetical protein
MRLAFVVLAFVILSPAFVTALNRDSTTSVGGSVLSAAHNVYGSSTNLTVFPADDPGFDSVFSNYDLYAVVENDTSINHVMAYKASNGHAFDITKGYSQLMVDASVPLVTSANAIAAAKAFAQTGNAELSLSKSVVYSGDSSWLGVTVADPSAVFLIGSGWQVSLWTWTQENGIVANWTFRFGLANLTRSEWWVDSIARGPFSGSMRAVAIPDGLQIVNRYTTSTHTLESYVHDGGPIAVVILPGVNSLFTTQIGEWTNWDGSIWRVRYSSPHDEPVPDLAEERAAIIGPALVEAYNHTFVGNSNCPSGENPPDPNWLFHSVDPDCILIVNILAQDIIAHTWLTENKIDSVMDVSILYKEQANAVLYYMPSNLDITNLTRVAAAHEVFHLAAWAFTGQVKADWDSYSEAQARFSETLSNPDLAHISDSLFYRDVSHYMQSPETSFCKSTTASSGYSEALFWGYLYTEDGGLALIKSVLEGLTEQTTATGTCDFRIAENVTRSLGEVSETHSTFAEARTDFAYSVYLRDFEWGSPNLTNARDWGDNLDAPSESVQLIGNQSYDIGAWGIKYVNLSAIMLDFTIHCSGSGAGWDFTVIRRDTNYAASRTTVNCNTGLAIDPDDWETVVFVAVRRDATPNAFRLQVII